MNFLRKNAKTIVAFITGAVLIGGITTYAAYNYYASQVSYTKKDGTEISVEDALNDLYSKKDWELLWTNPSPNSSFNAQTLPLNLSNYKYVVIIAKATTSLDYLYRTSTILPIGNSEVFLHVGATGGSAMRDVKALSTGIEFTAASNNNNSFVIPLKIYGIKSDLGIWNDIVGE